MNHEIFYTNLRRMDKLAGLLTQALEQLEARKLLPQDVTRFDPDQLPPDDSLILDGFRARFADLQDMLGKVMFKSIASMDEDESPGRGLTTRERVVLMEKRGILDTQQWQDVREIRNAFTHDYPDQHREKAEHLNAAWEQSRYLLAVVKQIDAYAADHYGAETCD